MPNQTLNAADEQFVKIVIFRCNDYIYGIDANYVRGAVSTKPENTISLTTELVNIQQALLIQGTGFEYYIGITGQPSIINLSASKISNLPYFIAVKNQINGLVGIATDDSNSCILLLDPVRIKPLQG